MGKVAAFWVGALVLESGSVTHTSGSSRVFTWCQRSFWDAVINGRVRRIALQDRWGGSHAWIVPEPVVWVYQGSQGRSTDCTEGVFFFIWTEL